jgi:hypothetical protein
MASTLRLVESHETEAPAQKRSRTHGDLPAAMAGADNNPSAAKARIKFDSLPTVLRAVVSDASDNGITIEAELPWLTVGTALQADCPNGVEYTARVHSFDLDVTGSGAARLRIFAALSAPAQPHAAAPPSKRPRQPTRPRLRRLLAFGAFVATATLLCAGVG